MTLLNLAETHLPQQIQANLIAYMRLFTGLPGVVYSDDASCFWIVSNQPAPGNIVLQFAHDDTTTESRIDTLFSRFPQGTQAVDWFVFPQDRPQNLGQRLEARGMPGTRGGNWLWGDLAALPPASNLPALFHIERVRNQSMLDQWVRVSSAGFQTILPLYFPAYMRQGFAEDASSSLYIGYLGNTPVTSGTLLDAGGCAVVYDISTPPGYRGRGYGRAITLHMLLEARRRGYIESWIWSSDLGKRVYNSLGFVDVDYGLREHTWQHSPR